MSRREFGRYSMGACVFAVGLTLAAATAQADVVISSQATQGMSCSGGVCSPTASDAVLNVTDLENLLASGSVEVTTTGAHKVQASNIDVEDALSWSTSNALALDANAGITINQKILVAGLSELSLTTSQYLYFGKKGHIAFANTSSQMVINGTSYALMSDIASLASAIAANPSGTYALANDYDASADGTYSAAPIQTVFTGTFNGLGNAVTHLSIEGSGYLGFFGIINNGAVINNFSVLNSHIKTQGYAIAGLIAGYAGGYLTRDCASGWIRGKGDFGGLVGSNGVIELSSADVTLKTSLGGAGGLSGVSASVDQSFATGSVTVTGKGQAGGLVGASFEFIYNSYATGAANAVGQKFSKAGGFAGETVGVNGGAGSIQTSYSTGAVSGGPHSLFGGFAGTVHGPSKRYNKHDYWDTDTSGTEEGTGKGNEGGIVGLTTSELQSGLPEGFDPAIWAEDPKINNGFPYLINNPPPK